MPDLGIGEAIAALGGAGGLGSLLGLGGSAAAAAAPEVAAASAPLDLLSFGTAAGTAIPEAVGTVVPATGALASGLATEPGLAAGALGAFAPGLDTTAAGLGGADAFAAAPGGAGAAPGLTPGSLDALSATGTPSGSLPAGVTAPTGSAIAAPSAAAPAAPGAAGAAPNAGFNVSSALGVDPTSSATTGAGGVANLSGGGAVAPGDALTNIGAAPTQSAGAGGSFLDKLSPSALGGNLVDSVTKNLPGLGLAGAGLAYTMAQGNKQSAPVQALSGQAAQQGALGTQLESYLTSGTLPPGLQSSVDQAVKNAKASAISNMASQGQSTDPTKNTALAAELAAIDQQTPILTAQIGQQLLSSGQAATGLSSQVYTTLANIDQTQTANIGKAIASMAAALSGKTTINIGATG